MEIGIAVIWDPLRGTGMAYMGGMRVVVDRAGRKILVLTAAVLASAELPPREAI